MNIYPSITSTAGNWRETIKQAKEAGLKEACFFPTCLTKEERKEAYELLEDSGIESIPLVHLKDDMDIGEIGYLKSQFNVQAFNCHTRKQYKMKHDISMFKDMVYLENNRHLFDDGEIDNMAGICIDFSHLEDAKMQKTEEYDYFMDICKKHHCGCAHVSAIGDTPIKGEVIHYSNHAYDDLKQFDYLKDYKGLFPDIVALELENTIAQQLKAKEYIEALLND